MHTYVAHFKTGDVQYTTNLDIKEFDKRLDRLDWLRVLTEGYEDGEGYNICQKALRAFNRTENFNGIIRLSFTEKDFLGYMLDSDMLDDRDIEVLKFYIG